jgi:PKD repeat protein
MFDASASCGGAVTGGGCTGSSAIVSYAWTFGDGSSGTGKTVTHTYVTTGTFNATLTVTNDRGVAASKTQAIAVGATAAPTASFVFSPTAPQVGQAIMFNADASRAAIDRAIVSYSWSFGDGDTAVGAGATHPFVAAGTYNVVLNVTDDVGQKGTASQSVTVTGRAAEFARGSFHRLTDEPGGHQQVVFDAATSTTGQGQTIVRYQWNFGDGTTMVTEGSTRTILHSFPTAQIYTVNLVVTDSAERTGSTQLTVTVLTSNPTARLSLTKAGGINIIADASASTATGTSKITSYSFNWGDGSQPSGPGPASLVPHAYPAPVLPATTGTSRS